MRLVGLNDRRPARWRGVMLRFEPRAVSAAGTMTTEGHDFSCKTSLTVPRPIRPRLATTQHLAPTHGAATASTAPAQAPTTSAPPSSAPTLSSSAATPALRSNLSASARRTAHTSASPAGKTSTKGFPSGSRLCPAAQVKAGHPLATPNRMWGLGEHPASRTPRNPPHKLPPSGGVGG